MSKYLLFTLASLLLAACTNINPFDAPGTAPTMSIAAAPADRLSAQEQQRIIASFNSQSVDDVLEIRISDLEQNGLLNRTRNLLLPQELATKYAAHVPMQNAALQVYQKGLLRGYNEDLMRAYFRSEIGYREVRTQYIFFLAKACGVEDAARPLREQIWQTGSASARFTCPSDADLNERRTPR